jgi:hypothetical protein
MLLLLLLLDMPQCMRSLLLPVVQRDLLLLLLLLLLWLLVVQEGDVAGGHHTFQVHLCFWQRCDEVLPTLFVLNRQIGFKAEASVDCATKGTSVPVLCLVHSMLLQHSNDNLLRKHIC